MDSIEKLIRLARVYASRAGVELTTVSWRLFGDSKKLTSLIAGSDIQVRRLEQAMAWLSSNWPDDRPWPSDIPRPPTDAATQPQAVAPAALENPEIDQ